MFTGIVQDIGKVEELAPRAGDMRLVIRCDRLDPARFAIGDSICVQGCCLTVVETAGAVFAADVSRETLAVTTLGELRPGAAVNLEPALRAGDALGGHLLSGHVDGVGEVLELVGDARSQRVSFGVPAPLARYIASKGSVAVDGVSLTVNEVEDARFGVNLIPHTQAVTTLGSLRKGTHVNLEIDLLARYVARLLAVADR